MILRATTENRNRQVPHRSSSDVKVRLEVEKTIYEKHKMPHKVADAEMRERTLAEV